MDTFFHLLRLLHIVAGLTALAVFVVPMLTRKGGKLHRTVGWVYVVAMGIVAVSSVVMSSLRLSGVVETPDGRRPFAVFLMFIALLSGSGSWFGLRVLRQKKRVSRHSGVVDVGVSAALLVGAVATSLYGLSLGAPLLSWFPTVGMFVGWRQLRYWLMAPVQPRHWWLEHMTGMFVSCIATVTAFLVFGSGRLLGGGPAPLLVWFLPTAVLVPTLIVWQRYYRRRFGAPEVPPDAPQVAGNT